MNEIGDLMRPSINSISSRLTVSEALLHFLHHRVDCLLVKESGKFAGIIYKDDIKRRIMRGKLTPETTRVYEIMTQPIPSIDLHMPIKEASRLMVNHPIQHFAVTESGRIVGILSVKDMISAFIKRF
ncbi:MAG: cyclic nucleotide-binding/CBS domain-containing protein [Nitrospinaceae bacterium]